MYPSYLGNGENWKAIQVYTWFQCQSAVDRGFFQGNNLYEPVPILHFWYGYCKGSKYLYKKNILLYDI